ncbi:MAG TPA: hypothetical protein VI790_01995 [Candidatus Nanoarchaeia archaeon]|nr:hypothetical protein [Candidatus Nanoarchaeia archaeon]
MAKFLIQSVFAMPTKTVLVGIVQDGTITVGMKSQALETMTVVSIESMNKKISAANTGMNVGLHVNKLSMKTEASLFGKIIDFN